MAWNILIYETPNGQPVVEKFLKSLQLPVQQKVTRQLRLLMEYGLALGMPQSKALGNGLLELRVRGDQELRVFYIFAVAEAIYLLHGFQKKSQATPKRELDLARRRQQEIASI